MYVCVCVRYRPIIVFPMGSGTPCPPQSALQQVGACAVPSPPPCTSCNDGLVGPNDTDVDCGHASGCSLCGESQMCVVDGDCGDGLVCGTLNTCIGEWVRRGVA